MVAKLVLLVLLALLGAGFVLQWMRVERNQARRVSRTHPPGDRDKPFVGLVLIGIVTDFLDTLGVGSFATTTSLFKLGGLVADEDIPGTLNVGHALPTIAEALIYISIVEVDITTLTALVAAAMVGAYLGAGVVARWPRRKIQIGMGALLLIAAGIIVLRQLALLPGGGAALGVTGTRLWVGVLGNALLGALMTLGIGLFAPCMILISLLGMNATTAFPIMMGSCAFLMPVAGLRFIRSRRYDLRAACGLTLGGLPAVLGAAYLVTSLPLGTVKWLVVGVVVYTAAAMLNSARAKNSSPGQSAAGPPGTAAAATAQTGERTSLHE